MTWAVVLGVWSIVAVLLGLLLGKMCDDEDDAGCRGGGDGPTTTPGRTMTTP